MQLRDERLWCEIAALSTWSNNHFSGAVSNEVGKEHYAVNKLDDTTRP